MALSPQFLDELRARTTISTLVQRTVSLKKKGREWSGCCPFHNEKTPSFTVNDEKGFYHCFGCSAHGDAIRWMTDHMGMEFMDAVKELAQAAGMEMPARDSMQSGKDRELDEGRDIVRRAEGWFRDNLRVAQSAIDYLTSRGITKEVAEVFAIGWAGSGATSLKAQLPNVDVSKLVKFGLLREKEGEEPYDFFRNRIMIPIHDARGRAVGFGGRIVGKGEPKYLNSPDTPLFDKGRSLFNLHRASPASRKTGRLVIVEGYMDVIALHRAGMDDAVAPNGTALTEAQMQLAWRLVDVPILCMDGDRAGKAAAARAAIRALPLLEPGKSLSFVSPPEGKDPDDILRDGGPEAVQAMFAKPQPLVAVLWAHERAATPCQTPEEVAGFKSRMRNHVRSIKNADVREAYGQDIAKRFHDEFDAPQPGALKSSHLPGRQPRGTWKKPAVQASPAQKQIRSHGVGLHVERAIVDGLIRYPTHVSHELAARAQFRDPEVNRLIDLIIVRYDRTNGCTEQEMRDFLAEQGAADVLARITKGIPPYIFTRKVSAERQREAQDMLIAVLRGLAV